MLMRAKLRPQIFMDPARESPTGAWATPDCFVADDRLTDLKISGGQPTVDLRDAIPQQPVLGLDRAVAAE